MLPQWIQRSAKRLSLLLLRRSVVSRITLLTLSRQGLVVLHNGGTVDLAVKKARCENYRCKRKGHQQQLDHELELLDKFDEASSTVRNKSYDKVKAALEEGTGIVSKRIKALKLADKSEFGWQTINEYLSDEFGSNSDDGKRMYRAERRAEKKIKGKRRHQHRTFTMEPPSLFFRMYFRIRKDRLQAPIMQPVRM